MSLDCMNTEGGDRNIGGYPNISGDTLPDTSISSYQSAPPPTKEHLTPHQYQVRALQQHFAEMLRDKGIICQDFLENGECMLIGGECPYAHVRSGREVPIPDAICNFFLNGKCLRDKCKYFHGTKAQIAELLSIKRAKLLRRQEKGDKNSVIKYRPQDYLPKRRLPAELTLKNIERMTSMSSEKGIPLMSSSGFPQPMSPLISPSGSMSIQSGTTMAARQKMSISHSASQQTPSGMMPPSVVGANYIPQFPQMPIPQQIARHQSYMVGDPSMQIPCMPSQHLGGENAYNVLSHQQTPQRQAGHHQTAQSQAAIQHAAQQHAARQHSYIPQLPPQQSHPLQQQYLQQMLHNPTNMCDTTFAAASSDPQQQALLYMLQHQQLSSQFPQYQPMSPQHSTGMFAPPVQLGSVIGEGVPVPAAGGIHQNALIYMPPH